MSSSQHYIFLDLPFFVIIALVRTFIDIMDLPAPSIIRDLKRRLFTPLVILAEILGVLSVVLIGVWVAYYPVRSGFHWDLLGKIYIHPFIMTVGMVFVFGNSTLLYRISDRLSIRPKLVKTCHVVMMMIVLACTAVGIYLAVTSIIGKTLDNVHAVLGIATTTLFVLQFICALFIFVTPCAPEWLKVSYLHLHAFIGILTLVSATATCLTGIQVGQAFFGSHPAISLSLTMFIPAFTAIIIYILSNEVYRAKRNHQIN
ncbi:cytochrome b561 isoform X1 [Strongylocentrotus purpuratus]|uniref:Cytochrome b561 domain-containing protein n=2 Tax=Strongylocentrotus purpuratus TaxID=7668 RepID=A0A7M7N2Z4_STRPU|nr:cytochrome b561 isoform X1 [Strongylocentrotus purpuratus]